MRRVSLQILCVWFCMFVIGSLGQQLVLELGQEPKKRSRSNDRSHVQDVLSRTRPGEEKMNNGWTSKFIRLVIVFDFRSRKKKKKKEKKRRSVRRMKTLCSELDMF
ncbi:hypothetical protein HanIR_Chr07g0328001 [Helianthus annuus]|nr:hypothetical protein HanIR_Chr07g0328001 [Helianthus annuus]